MNKSQKMLQFIASHFGLGSDDLAMETQLTDLNVPTVEMVDLYQKLEDTFGIKIDPTQIKNLETIGDIIDLVISHEEDSDT